MFLDVICLIKYPVKVKNPIILAFLTDAVKTDALCSVS